MRIERFDPVTDDEQLRACHQMTVDSQPADDPNVPPPPFGVFRFAWAYGFEDRPTQAWVGLAEDGTPVGAYVLELPVRENRENAFGSILIPPGQRRRGYGRALLTHMTEQAAAAGRARVLSTTRASAPGDAFAGATGGRPGQTDVRRMLGLDESLRDRLPRLRVEAQSKAAGYELRSWLGPAPDDLAAGLCAVLTALADAPHDAEYEPASWDPARLRAFERRLAETGARWHSIAAIGPAGEVAALTQVNLHHDQPDFAGQAVTAVTSRHRGHRLGLLIKVAMLDLLLQSEPEVQRIVTYNGVDNDHMVAINEQLGYRISDYFQFWQHDTPAARPLAAGQS
jgi:GNAT superfamily N-acetyltransferase